MERTGNIRISSENMMPIIKKWLYSEKDIFLREIVANASDAITKLQKLIEMGEAEKGGDFRITVTTDEAARTLTVEDNGIGMTEEEVEKYITQIAFSGAADFLEKYEKSGDGIIGHFGLGFYSAYMVSDRIEIFTKSYQAGAKAVHWESDGESTYTIADCDKESVGTRVVMHLAEGEEEFCRSNNVRALLAKYCSFMPYEIYLDPKGGEDKPVNVTSPLYLKAPKDCTEEEYRNFYRDTFFDFNEPLFQIHLNMEYPFRLKGILYFPKVRDKLNLERGQVKLYCNQVFVADNIKEVIPEFLMLLNGVIDCPDIPLNVSRSFLQNDSQVKKIAKYIVKKVADCLNDLYREDRARFEKCWPDLQTFIKFGCIKDDDFYGKVRGIIVYRNLSGEYVPVESVFGPEEEGKDESEPPAAYYVSDEKRQAQYVTMFRNAGLDALIADSFIDPHFLSYLEYKNPTRVRFLRIDADVANAVKEEAGEDKELETLFTSVLGDRATVRTERLKDASLPAIVNIPEFVRRTAEMSRYYGAEEQPSKVTLVVNASCPAVLALKDAGEEAQKEGAEYFYLLALMNLRALSPEELAAFTSLAAKFAENYLKTK